jgi:hypothetical protein
VTAPGHQSSSARPTCSARSHSSGTPPLQDVLQKDYGLDLSDWNLRAATGVSDAGKTLVGYGYRRADGYVQAFLEAPPPLTNWPGRAPDHCGYKQNERPVK